MASKQTVTLDQVLDAIVNATRNQFPDLAMVEVLWQDLTLPGVPACLIEFTEAELSANRDDGTGRLPVLLTFSAMFLVGFRQNNDANPAVEAAKLALAWAAFAKNQRWGLPIGAAELVGVYQDAFSPAQDQFECYRVDWMQEVYLGEDVWKLPEDATPPGNVWVGFAPLIGADHVDDYVKSEAAHV